MVRVWEEYMAGFAETVTDRAAGMSFALVERTIGLVARAIVRVDEINVELSQRNAQQAVTANRAWRSTWEES
jgi:hypothetical protein